MTADARSRWDSFRALPEYDRIIATNDAALAVLQRVDLMAAQVEECRGHAARCVSR